jgi:hypothetical protein
VSKLTAWSLNCGRFVGRTPDEEPQTLKWLKGLSESNATLPDVLCLQDIQVSMLKYLRPLPHFHFAPMTNHRIWGKRELWGICIASKYPLTDIAVHYTWGDGIVRDLEGIGDDNERMGPGNIVDELVLKSLNWVAIACSIRKTNNPKPFRIATHHGFWVRGGVPTPEQMRSTDSLRDFLARQGQKHHGVVYAADCNPDKEGKVMAKYLKSGGRDYLPSNIETTLAKHHPASKLGIKADHVMMWPNVFGEYTYDITDVYLDSSPGSDHDMLCFTVNR